MGKAEVKRIADGAVAIADRDELVARLTAALAADGAERVERYLDFFFNSDQEPGKTLTKPLAKKHPDLADRLKREQERLPPLVERRKAVAGLLRDVRKALRRLKEIGA